MHATDVQRESLSPPHLDGKTIFLRVIMPIYNRKNNWHGSVYSGKEELVMTSKFLRKLIGILRTVQGGSE